MLYGRITAQVGDFPASTNVLDLLPANGGDGSAGFVLYGPTRDGHAGQSLELGGDYNNDGIPDLIIGANGYSDFSFIPQAGRVYVVYGRPPAP